MAKGNGGSKPRKMSDIMAKKKPTETRAHIQIDGSARFEIEDLRRKLEDAKAHDRRHNEAPTAPAVEEELEEAHQRFKESEVVFIFRPIASTEYDDLIALHPPRDQDKENGLNFNAETFPPVLIAASSYDPEISVDEAEGMFDDPAWNAGELVRLWNAALAANNETGDIPLSNPASVQIQDFISALDTP